LDVSLTIEALAARARWSDDQTRHLVGRVRGDTLGAWGENLTKRFGPDALDRIRRRVPDEIAPVLGEQDRVPVFAQLLLTEAIVDEFLAGDLLALYPLLAADTRAGLGRVQLALLRTLGAGGAFRLAPRSFRKVHERGEHDVEIGKRTARFTFAGNPLFAHPTWRVLQVFATRVVLELANTPGTIESEDADDGFIAVARW
jgi:hypothetical protein